MSTTSQFPSATLPRDFARQLNEHIVDAGREVARLCLDTYEKMLESIATYHDRAASETDVEQIATATKAQAKLIRDVAERQVATGRELLKMGNGSSPAWPSEG
jgi:hypothetical protein